MRPEISRLLYPVYGPELENFEKEDRRLPIPGMGSLNTWFVHHEFRESKVAQRSTLNVEEGAWIAEFAAYLVINGTPAEDISILTFYNGQRRHIIKCLRSHPVLCGKPQPGVFTVDSYQGEENEVILLSLVRNNDRKNAGFTSNPNRVNVALSRARRGLYVFGNMSLLWHAGGDLWWEVLKILDNEGPESTRLRGGAIAEVRAGTNLPIVCGCGVPTHETDRQACHQLCDKDHEPETTFIRSAADLVDLNGGCGKKCPRLLPCGHDCPYKCHP